MPEIGNTLRETRIRKGLSIKDVEGVTRIRSKYLEALEQDDFSVLPGPTYVTAFLRTYANFLKINAEALIDEYKRNHEPRRVEEPSTIRVEPTSARGSRGTSAKGSRGRAERQKRKPRRYQRGYILIGVLAVIIVVLLAWLGVNGGRGGTAPIGSESIPNSGSTTSLGAVSSTTLAPGAGGTTTTASVVLNGQDVTLVLKVTTGSCWLVVREDSKDGAELYAGTLSANGQKTFDSSKRYWMNVGKPDALAVTVIGRAVALGTTPGSFVVTEAGVQAGQ